MPVDGSGSAYSPPKPGSNQLGAAVATLIEYLRETDGLLHQSMVIPTEDKVYGAGFLVDFMRSPEHHASFD